MSVKTTKSPSKKKSPIERLFEENKGGVVTYEALTEDMGKQPTSAVTKKIMEQAEKAGCRLQTNAELIKEKNSEDARKRAEELRKLREEENSEFDLMRERELLEWSRSDSPVRMYLREMGQINLLTKDEET